MKIEELKKAIAEYLETCDGVNDEEFFMTMREFADWQLGLFARWAEGRVPAFQVAECRTCKQSESDPALISLGSAQASHLCLWLDKYFKPDFGCTQYEPKETDD